MDTESILQFCVWYPVFVMSTTLHEAAHAWTAKLGGDLTAYHNGQVTLDPTPHVRREPFGMVLMPVLSFFFGGWMIGWASTPYDRIWERRYPKRAALMSLAGPAANLLLVLIAAVAMRVGLSAGALSLPGHVSFASLVIGATPGWHLAAQVLSVMFSLNLLLCVFNLLPVPPLDGSGVLPLFLPERAARSYHDALSNSTLAWVGLLIAWRVFGFIFGPVYATAVQLLLS